MLKLVQTPSQMEPAHAAVKGPHLHQLIDQLMDQIKHAHTKEAWDERMKNLTAVVNQKERKHHLRAL